MFRKRFALAFAIIPFSLLFQRVDFTKFFNSPKPIIPVSTITITPTISPSVTPSLSPTLTPAPTLAPKPTAANEPITAYLIREINTYRRSYGLTDVQTDPHTCSFAQTRAKEISISFSHKGFDQRASSHTLPFPGYSKLTENIEVVSSYTRVIANWINSPGHATNMRADTPYVCVEKYGNYYAYEGWKP